MRNPNRRFGLIGMASIRNPTASSTADANTAETGMTPASPAPLMPNGFSGEGVTWWPSSNRSGISVAYGIRKSMNDAFSDWPCSS